LRHLPALKGWTLTARIALHLYNRVKVANDVTCYHKS
jgi:hypothetical protein